MLKTFLFCLVVFLERRSDLLQHLYRYRVVDAHGAALVQGPLREQGLTRHYFVPSIRQLFQK